MDNNKTRYYDCLGLEYSANREEVAAAFRKHALTHHPMRNPRENEAMCYQKFVKTCEAYEVLSDPLMKRIYDKYGEYSLKQGVPKGVDKFAGYVNKGVHFELFEKFFGSTNPYVEN
jgi:DnaJ-class molecular chaperone